MKLLFLANRFPYPPYRGDKLKIYHLAKRLMQKGHELHLLTFIEEETDRKYLPELQKIFTRIELVSLPKSKAIFNTLFGVFSPLPFQVSYFRSDELKQKLDEMLVAENYEGVHVQHLRMAPYLAENKNIPRILDLPDAFSLYWERRKKVSKNLMIRFLEGREAKRVFRYEDKVLQQFDLSLCCSQEDIDYLKEHHPVKNLRLLPNGVDLDTFYPREHDYSRNKTLLFTGNMDYAPNVDAVLYFCKEILPVVLKSFPHVQFIIAGQRPVPLVKALESESVVVTGFIEDLGKVYNDASVVVAPLRFGAGTQNKVLEAMAMGIPVVCSEVGFKGLGIENDHGAMMRTDADSFAAAIVQLLRDQSMREAMGKEGIAVMRRHFSWDTIAEKLENYFREITA